MFDCGKAQAGYKPKADCLLLQAGMRNDWAQHEAQLGNQIAEGKNNRNWANDGSPIHDSALTFEANYIIQENLELNKYW